jgi:hypothetical protein
MHLKKIPGSGGQMELTAIVEDQIVLLNCQLKVEEKVYNSATQVQMAGDDEASSGERKFLPECSRCRSMQHTCFLAAPPFYSHHSLSASSIPSISPLTQFYMLLYH